MIDRLNLQNRLTAVRNRSESSQNPTPRTGVTRDQLKIGVDSAFLASLTGETDLSKLSADSFLGAGQSAAELGSESLKSLIEQMSVRGVKLDVDRSANEVSVIAERGAVTVDLLTHEVRIASSKQFQVFKNGTVMESGLLNREGVWEVTRNGKTQEWDPYLGKGLENGKPIVPRWADAVPGEAPRKPSSKKPVNHLKEPLESDTSREEFARLYEAAVVASGGRIIEPMSLDWNNTEAYNCHSFATTSTRGDLHDPFDNTNQPRWVNFPTYQFANGPFRQLRPNQKAHLGDVVLYRDAGIPTHTGIIVAVDRNGNPTRIRSKWGAYGLYEHGPFDVPTIYGSVTEIYRPTKQ